jgi:hypothetical protein
MVLLFMIPEERKFSLVRIVFDGKKIFSDIK